MLIGDLGATLSRQIVSMNFSSRMTHLENLEPISRKIFDSEIRHREKEISTVFQKDRWRLKKTIGLNYFMGNM